MQRRYALLDDNQRLLEECIGRLRTQLPALIVERMCAATIIGSVAEGRARDQSDIDLLLVLRSESPRRADYRWWDEYVQPRLNVGGTPRFPVQPLIIGRESLATEEPHLRRALATGLPLWDPERLLHDQPEARA
jgi:predicted nucleotidyltransferase